MASDNINRTLMYAALEEAHKAYDQGEVPVGAVVCHEGELIARACNQIETSAFAGAHAEMLALKAAAEKLNRWRLSDCTLVVTLEPCAMCMGAIRLARIATLVYGAPDPRMGSAGSVYDLASSSNMGPIPQITSGVLEDECSTLLKSFFRELRN